jgi:HPt (histidine-containing phosphotransfer) domain-containing protein
MLQIINLSSVDDAKSIMKDKFPIMIKYFLEDAVNYISSIEDGLKISDHESIEFNAHTIKSSANQLGAEKMSEIARQMERLAKEIKSGSGDFQQLNTLFDELKNSFAQVEQELKKLAG